MRRIYLGLVSLLGLIVGFMSSCSDDDVKNPDPTLDVANAVLEVEAIASEKPYEIKVASNYEWSATRPEADTWLTLKQEEGKLLVSVEANLDTIVRTSKITIAAGLEDNQKISYVDVTQKAADPTSLMLSTNKLEFSPDGETHKITAMANSGVIKHDFVEVSTETNDWCTVAIEGMEISVTTIENQESTSRSLKLVLTAGEGNNLKSDTVDVLQRGNSPFPEFVDTRDTIYVQAEGEEIVLEVSSKIEWDYSTWGTHNIKNNIKREGNKLIVSAPPYFSLDQQGFCRIMLSYSTEESEFPVSGDKIFLFWPEADKVQMSLSKEQVSMKNAGEKAEISVDANYPWNFEDPQVDWLTLTKSEDGKKLLLESKASSEEMPRQVAFKVTIGGQNNYIEKTIKVVQFGSKPMLTLSTNRLSLSGEGESKEVTVSSNCNWQISTDGGDGWLKYERKDDKIIFTVEATESTRSCRVLIASTEMDPTTGLPVTATLDVVQNKLYKVGDAYVVNGKTVGIVFSVTDGGAHGKVLSLAEAKDDWGSTRTLYCDLSGISDTETWLKDKSNLGPTSKDNGLENLQVYKDKRPSDWQTFYPMIGWCEKLKQETGNIEWYIPALNEWAELYEYVTGIVMKTEPGHTVHPALDKEAYDKAKKAWDDFNLKIEQMGGDKLYMDEGYHTSTETFETKICKRWGVDLPNGYVGSSSIWASGSKSATRAMCQF